MDVETATSYFDDCKPKYLKKFSEKTPEGNYIEGYICKKSNKYLGSLLITNVNGESVNQFVQSMPKIDYFNDSRDIVVVDKDINFHDMVAYEKLDGSCVILYPLFDKNGFILEIVPKTRGRAVADKHFLDLYNKCDHGAITEYYRTNTGILFFELYGILNQHEIIHYDTGIDLALIGLYTTRFYRPQTLNNIANKYGFKQPNVFFKMRYNRVLNLEDNKYQYLFRDVSYDECKCVDVVDCVDKIQKFLDYLNRVYYDINGRICTEGVVINCTNSEGVQKYIKVKPRDIENKHRCVEGVSRSSIVKECLKYFDDYGSEVFEIYNKDPNHHTEYLNRMLLEDYSEEYVKKSAKKIEKVFMQVWDSKLIPESIHNICSELFDEYSNQGITHCMRMFAQKYPMKKKQSKTVYNVLEKKFISKGVKL